MNFTLQSNHPKTKVLNTRVDLDTHKQIKAIAKKNKTKIGNVIRQMISSCLKQIKGK